MERQGLEQSLSQGAAVAAAVFLVPITTGGGCPEPWVGHGLPSKFWEEGLDKEEV